MSTPFVLPSLGESVDGALITRWLKSVGDTVEADEPLLEVATDKVDTEITAPHNGIIKELLAEEDSAVAVGEPLAVIQPTGTSPATPHAPSAASPPLTFTSETSIATTDSVPPAASSAPSDRNHSGTAEPTADEAHGQLSSPVTSQTEKMTRLRRTIASRMVESLRVSAQLTTVIEADISALARFRRKVKDRFLADTGIKLSYLPFFIKAAIEALPDHPMLNASVSTDSTEVTYHHARHLGIAVDSPKGLMVPVIRDASSLSITGLARAVADLAECTRAGSVSADELTGATFTITNTGSRGALFDTPIINQPQTGILGTGAVVERVLPQSDGFGGHNLTVGSTVYLSLSYDHRIVDGADAARFLGAVKKRLEAAHFAADL